MPVTSDSVFNSSVSVGNNIEFVNLLYLILFYIHTIRLNIIILEYTKT